MNNNKVFKTILNLTGASYNRENLIYVFELGGMKVTNSQIKGWRTDKDKDRASYMSDFALNSFFDGLFKYQNLQNEKGVQVFNFPKKGDKILPLKNF